MSSKPARKIVKIQHESAYVVLSFTFSLLSQLASSEEAAICFKSLQRQLQTIETLTAEAEYVQTVYDRTDRVRPLDLSFLPPDLSWLAKLEHGDVFFAKNVNLWISGRLFRTDIKTSLQAAQIEQHVSSFFNGREGMLFDWNGLILSSHSEEAIKAREEFHFFTLIPYSFIKPLIGSLDYGKLKEPTVWEQFASLSSTIGLDSLAGQKVTIIEFTVPRHVFNILAREGSVYRVYLASEFSCFPVKYELFIRGNSFPVEVYESVKLKMLSVNGILLYYPAEFIIDSFYDNGELANRTQITVEMLEVNVPIRQAVFEIPESYVGVRHELEPEAEDTNLDESAESNSESRQSTSTSEETTTGSTIGYWNVVQLSGGLMLLVVGAVLIRKHK